jgi:hypothetical protein
MSNGDDYNDSYYYANYYYPCYCSALQTHYGLVKMIIQGHITYNVNCGDCKYLRACYGIPKKEKVDESIFNMAPINCNNYIYKYDFVELMKEAVNDKKASKHKVSKSRDKRR